MASGTLLIGDDMLINNLRVKAEEMNEKAAKALKDAGGKIISSSIKRTPIKTGELRKRSFNEGPLKSGDSYVQVVGYEKFGGLWEYGRETVRMLLRCMRISKRATALANLSF